MSSRSPSFPTAFGRRAERPAALPGLRRVDLTAARAEYRANAEMAVAYDEPGEMQRRERRETFESESSGFLILLCGVFSGIVSCVGLTVTVLALMGKL